MIHRVSKENVADAWPYLFPVLQRALDKASGERTLNDVRKECESGGMQLWFGGKSALVTEIVTHPQQKVARMLLCGGRMEDVMDGWGEILAWARAEGCEAVEFCGRRGWIKALGFREAYTVARFET